MGCWAQGHANHGTHNVFVNNFFKVVSFLIMKNICLSFITENIKILFEGKKIVFIVISIVIIK